VWGYVVIFEAKKCPRANDLGNTALYRISLLVFITEAECISIVKPTRCTIFSEFIEYHFTCFGRTSRPSLGVQGCTHGIRSYRLVELQFRLVPASTQPANPYDIYLMLCVRSWSPDDGREDRPKHVEWFLISNFRRVLYVVCFLLGNSPASEFYMPTFRNTLFHLHMQVGVEWLNFWIVGISIRERVWLENGLSRHPPSNWLKLFSSQTLSRMDTPTVLKFSHYIPTCL